MATRASRPVRTLLVFVAVIAVMYVAVAVLGTWKPKLGLDLQGGTRITLQAQAAGGSVTSDKLSQAVDIISSRVNGAGVAESQVTTQGNNIVTVEIPGKVDDALAQTIGATAQLRFRVVAAVYPAERGVTVKAQGNQTSTVGKPAKLQMSAHGGAHPYTWSATGLPTGLSIAPKSGLISGTPTATKSFAVTVIAKDAAQGSNAATFTWTIASANAKPPTKKFSVGPPSALSPPNLLHIPDPWAWIENPPSSWQQKAATYQCPTNGKTTTKQLDVPSQPLLACDAAGLRYLLGPAVVEGTDVTNASAGIPQGEITYAVTLSFNGTGTREFGDVTTRTAITNSTSPNSGDQVAIVLDGKVLSAPTNQQSINGGQAIITGSQASPFTQASSSNLANALKYGALPLSFTIEDTTTQGPELASGQLNAGIVAGIVGLILVVAYCLLYYRALAFVVVSSLVIAGLITYASVLLLAHAYGFTLTLPGIAGLIVAVGITADSFIVYFERLRDEVRDGKTLRTSVETGWVRARSTILAADSVSMLAALVLFIFAIGVVKGFAFALGLTTFIDIFVVFFFTKPVMTLLARTKFFGQGHRLSGLDRQHLGMAPLKTRSRTVRGQA